MVDKTQEDLIAYLRTEKTTKYHPTDKSLAFVLINTEMGKEYEVYTNIIKI